MQKEEIIDIVKTALVKTIKLSESTDVDINASLKDEYGLDSMSSLVFLMELEESITGFNVNAETLEEKHLTNISSVVDYIELELSITTS